MLQNPIILLIIRNFKLKTRNFKSTSLEIFIPIFLVLLSGK